MGDHTNPQKKRFGSKELRLMEVPEGERKKIKRNPVYIILDNVLDTYNIGAIFRLADAVSASKIFIGGDSEIPPNHRIKKASINTTEWVPWEYSETAVEAIAKLRREFSTTLEQYSSSEVKPNREVLVVAVEQDKRSVSYTEVDYSFPIALVVGHETDGVSQETLNACDQIVEIPMWGVNKSMNVMVSLAIVLFKAMEKLPKA
jgi:23S rRNA (guanosine2251-2'-O)-methyltransferase